MKLHLKTFQGDWVHLTGAVRTDWQNNKGFSTLFCTCLEVQYVDRELKSLSDPFWVNRAELKDL